jgi:hypothetical protein
MKTAYHKVVNGKYVILDEGEKGVDGKKSKKD